MSQGVELRHKYPGPSKLLLCLLGSSLVPSYDLNQGLDLRDHGDRVDAAHLSLAQQLWAGPGQTCYYRITARAWRADSDYLLYSVDWLGINKNTLKFCLFTIYTHRYDLIIMY